MTIKVPERCFPSVSIVYVEHINFWWKVQVLMPYYNGKLKNRGFRDQLCSVDITEKMGICACWEKSNLKFSAISHVKVFIFKLRGGDMERLLTLSPFCSKEWTQWTQTSLRRFQEVLKRSRHLMTKPDVVTTSSRRVRFTTS